MESFIRQWGWEEVEINVTGTHGGYREGAKINLSLYKEKKMKVSTPLEQT